MMDELQEAAKELLKDENAPEMKVISEMAKMGEVFGREVVKEIAERPEVSDEAKKYIWGNGTSPDLKAYKSGLEEGIKIGHSNGMSKGVVLGAGSVAGVALMAAGWYLLTQNKKK